MLKNRLEQIFADLRTAGHSALMPFITAGYPDLATTAALLHALEAGGASICEVGIPFSDPVADGPVIAASMHEALENGFDLEALFELIATVRPHTKLGLVAMVSYSIVQRYGLNEFVQRSAAVGFDGFIFPDLPLEESAPARAAAAAVGLTCSLLIAPNTPPARAREIANACTGFVYLLARIGITGAHSEVPEIGARVAELRNHGAMTTPIACGFGISSPDAVHAVTQHADAAIVGSALIKRLTVLLKSGTSEEEIMKQITTFINQLATGSATA